MECWEGILGYLFCQKVSYLIRYPRVEYAHIKNVQKSSQKWGKWRWRGKILAYTNVKKRKCFWSTPESFLLNCLCLGKKEFNLLDDDELNDVGKLLNLSMLFHLRMMKIWQLVFHMNPCQNIVNCSVRIYTRDEISLSSIWWTFIRTYLFAIRGH